MYTVAQLFRLKASVPFSTTLNEEIVRLTDGISAQGIKMVLVDHDPFNDYEDQAEYFAEMKRKFHEDKVIEVWTGGTDDNIYGSAHMNHLFRFWHDHTHIVADKDFTPMSEIMVSQIQQLQLQSNDFDRRLIAADITGQVIYFDMFKQFPHYQRRFVAEYMQDGICRIQHTAKDF